MGDDTSRDGSAAEDQSSGFVAGYTVLAYLISGPLLYGGLGWLLDRWLGTQVFVAIGLVAGMALSLYMIVLRYVRPRPSDPRTDPGSDGDTPTTAAPPAP